MRKTLHILILLFALVAINVRVIAGQVSVATAQTTAVNFFTLNAKNLPGRTTITATLKYTRTETDGTVDFYVFDISPVKGFVVVAASDAVKPVIAYSVESNFNPPISTRGVQCWMDKAAANIYKGIQLQAVANPKISNQWSSYIAGTRPDGAKSLSAGIGPLLSTTWDQEPYYNQLCPFNSANNDHAVTGCAATTMAQIMKFWSYPKVGTGSYRYNDAPPTCSNNYGSQFANFGNTTYEWAAMPDSLTADNINVATIMYHCGVAVAMNYGDDSQGGSGSYVLASQTVSWGHSAQSAYSTYFGYNPNTIQGVSESDYTDSAWVSLLETELSLGHPIQYVGVDTIYGGHTWVCDGFDANDMMHMNWGWSGLDNGYYSVSALTPGGYNFSNSESALIGIQPMSDLTVTASATNPMICSGSSTKLVAQGNANVTYLWTPATGLSCTTCSTTTASPLTTTTYTVTIDSAGLTASSQATVIITNSPIQSTANVTNATTYGAANGVASVMATGGTPTYSYSWTNGVTSATNANLAAGSYQVTVSDAAGCTASAVANVSQPDSLEQPGSGGLSGGGQSGQSGQSGSGLTGHEGPKGPSGLTEKPGSKGALLSSALFSTDTTSQPDSTGSHNHGHTHDHYAQAATNTQAALWNQGSAIYVQQAALVEVQGNFINQNGGSNVYNDGIMEVSGNFTNDSGAVFTTGTNNNSTDRTVKFMGGGKQAIAGSMTGSSSFYNLVVDQAAASDTVEMQTTVNVNGSVVFGTANTTSTYNPSSLYTNNNQKGLFKTFNDSLGEFVLNIQNGSPDAIAGYPVLEMSGAPSTGFIVTSGMRGSANGGLQRAITSATSYLFPVGTLDKGFNAIRLNFAQIPGGGSVMAKFCSGSSNPNGAVGTISQFCDGCASGDIAAEGFSKYFASNDCNNGAPQWVAFASSLTNHGYWSLQSTNTGYTYDAEVFANTFGYLDPSNTTRLLKHEASYGVDPSGASVDWRPEIESLCSTASDLLTYTKNAGCYSGTGIPGGTYSNFSHFTIGTSGGTTALPVQLIYLTAQPTGKHHILVSWATALEINNKGFFVMRSLDGVNFSDIGWVDGHDNSTVTNTYTYDDRPGENAIYYYKLRQVDNNGKFTYSNIAEAQLTGAQSQDFALFPNPTASDIFLQVGNPSDEVKVDIYDIKGQLVYNNIFTVENTGSQITLTIHASAEMTLGTYILTASTNGAKFTGKVILQ